MSVAAPHPIAWTPYTQSRAYPEASISADLQLVEAWRDRKRELLAIRRYRDDWDGFGADAPNPNIIDTAIAFLDRLRSRDNSHPPFRVSLSPNGTVGIEWQTTSEYIEAEIVSYGRVEWMRVRPDQPVMHWTEPLLSREGTQDASWDGKSKESAAGAAVSASVR